MSRKGTTHTLTHTSITLLIIPRIQPYDKPSQTPTPNTTRISSPAYTYIVQWLHHLLRIYKINSFTAYTQLLHKHFNPPHPLTQSHT
jgi:hypothetical protein